MTPHQTQRDGGKPVFSQGDLPPLTERQVAGTDGRYQASIRLTSGGVPHIKAASLADAAFGEGYVQGKASVCIIADEILRATSRRAEYYGPGPGNINVITDFSYKALGLMARADSEFADLSAPTRAMLRGFAAGYNKYLADTTPADLPPRCANQPWVQPITAKQLFARMEVMALLSSGDRFATGVMFNAVPPGASATPKSAASAGSAATVAWMEPAAYRTHFRPEAAGASNGWGLGKAMTESGRGALLANPHFPYTGSRRFYQSQITVPGVVNVNGMSLIGYPLIQIGFNQDIAWTHTVSTSDRFTVYKLKLKAGDPLTYVKDGHDQPITTKTLKIKVKNGAGTKTLKRTFYYSVYGPMLNMHVVNSALPKWGQEGVAFTYRDANAKAAAQGIDVWLGLDRSTNLKQTQSVFEDCGRVFWVNTMYADRDGNAFYIDRSSVPNLSKQSIAAYEQRLASDKLTQAFRAAGMVLLDGSTSRDDWVDGKCGLGLVSYADSPKLLRQDFVQNSNNSYWATNPKHPLSGYSPLFGPAPGQISYRTRLGLTMLTRPTDPGLSKVKPAGDDGKFSAKDLVNMLYSDRAYLAETLLGDLLDRCKKIGNRKVHLPNGQSRPVDKGCKALAGWNGVYDLDSTGAATFRVFTGHYHQRLPGDYVHKFDPAHPITTPGDPKPVDVTRLAEDPMLQSLAEGLDDLDSVDIAYDARLGDVQVEHTSGGAPPGKAAKFTDSPIPWHGGSAGLEGAFNVVRAITSDVAQNTRYPIRIQPGAVPNTGGLSTEPGEGWLINAGTSFHFGLEFTDAGPVAYGLVSYSQSTNPSSPHYNDQDRLYSQKKYRKFEFTEAQIKHDPHFSVHTISAQK